VLLVCLAGAVLACAAYLLLEDDDDGGRAAADTPRTTLPEGDPVAADRVEVGTCFNDQGDEGAFDYTDFPVVGCDEPHDNEVYHLFEAEGGPEYPGNDRVGQLTRDGCLAAFEPYVGRAYTESALEILPIPPSQASWEGGDREVLCAVYDARREELRGSVRGSGR
jgi:hypothetical protein